MSRLSESNVHFGDPGVGRHGAGAPQRPQSPRTFRREAIRLAVLVGSVSAIGGFVLGRATRTDFACYVPGDRDSLTFYPGATALEAASKVPGSDNIDLRDIPMSTSRDGEMTPAANIHNVRTGLYGPDNCAKVN